MNTFTLSRNQMITLGAISMTSLMFGLEISSVPVILPSLQKLMGANFSDVQWIMNAYTIACTTVLMATGSLADRFGRKKLYLISIVLFGLTSLACGLVHTVSLLIAGRFFQGIGGGAMLICQIAVLSQQFREGKQRAFAFGLWGIVFGAGLGFGPVIGAMIMAISNWKWVFLIHLPISFLAWTLIYSGVQESRNPDAKGLNLAGILLLSATVFGLTYFITQAPATGIASQKGIVIVSATVASFLLFLWTEKTSKHPMFDFSVFRIRPFSGALMGSMGMNFSFWPFMIYFPIYFQYGLGYDVVATGLSLLAYTLPTLLIPPLAERLSMKYKPGLIIPAGLFTIGLGFLVLRSGISLEHVSWITLLPGSLLAGIGLGLTNTPVTNTATRSIPAARAGMASGIDMSARLITLAINIAVMGALLVTGINSYLLSAFPLSSPDVSEVGQLHVLSQKIASGSLENIPSFENVPSLKAVQPFIRPALVHGFGGVMLYAAIGVWVLAGFSALIFGIRTTKTDLPRTTQPDCCV